MSRPLSARAVRGLLSSRGVFPDRVLSAAPGVFLVRRSFFYFDRSLFDAFSAALLSAGFVVLSDRVVRQAWPRLSFFEFRVAAPAAPAVPASPVL